MTVAPASLIFTAGDWNQAKTVTVTALADADASDERATVAHAVTHTGGAAEYDGLAADDVTVTVADDESPALALPAGALRVGEGATAIWEVALATEPSGPVTVALASSDTGAATVEPASLAFTVEHWNVAQAVTVRGVDDADAGDESVTVTHTASGADYAAVSATRIVAIADDETAGVTVTAPDPLVFDEGASGTYEVVLDTPPSAGTVTVAAGSDHSAVWVNPSSLAFTAASWNTPQTVRVSAGEDDADAADERAAVAHTVTHTEGSAEYAGLDVDGVRVRVDDNDAPGLDIDWADDPDPLRVDEGATETYTVALHTRPAGTVTVALASSDTGAATVDPTSLSFTTGDWAPQTVTVTGVDDDDAGDEAVTVTHTASGADYEGKTKTLAVVVADDETAAVTVAGGPFTLDENGASETYTVVLDRPPSAGTVTVVVASSDPAVEVDRPSLRFTRASWSQAQTVTVTALDDDDAEGETATLTHTASHSGGSAEYDGLAGDDVTVTVTDDDTPALVLPAGPLGVDEGAAATYTVALRTQPAGTVTVTVVSDDTGAATVEPASLEFTTGNWDTPRTVTVIGVDDGDGSDESVTVTHTASGADYGAVSKTLAVAVADGDEPGVSVSPTSLALTEGGAGTNAATWTVVLDTLPSGGTVTGRARLVRHGRGDGGQDFARLHGGELERRANGDGDRGRGRRRDGRAGEGVAHGDAHRGLCGVRRARGGRRDGHRRRRREPGAGGDGAGRPAGGRRGGAAAAFTVALRTQPSGTVTVTVASSDTGAATVSPASLAFTTGDWDTPRTVTVTGAGDADAGDETVTLTLRASGADYAAVSATLIVAVADDDPLAVTVSPESLALDEDRARIWRATYTVVLATEPSGGTVRVAVASNDTGAATAAPAALIFTAASWDTAKTVTVTAAEDADASDETVAVSHTVTHTGGAAEYDGLDVADVTVTVDDAQSPGLVLPAGPLGVDENGTQTYTVALRTQPTGPVTVAVASSDTGAATVEPASLEFTAASWNVAQTVTVTGVDDGDGADESVTLTHTASGADYDGVEETLAVAVTDDDEPGVTVTGGPFTLTENGAAGIYTVVLATLPSAGTVTVTVASDDAAVTVDPTSLAFTASDWNVAQALTVTAVDDANATGETATLAHTAAHTGGAAEYAGLAGRTVRITVDDDDAPGLALVWTGDPDPLAVTEGGAATTYTVALHTQPSGPVTVAVASSDTGAATVDTSSLTFTTGNWDTPQIVTVTGAVDDDAGAESVTLTHTASGADYGAVSKTLAVAVADDDTAAVTVTGGPFTLDEGASATYTVVLATLPSAGTVTVAVASSDPAVTVDKTSLAFTASDWNVAKTVTVEALDDDDASDETATLTHTASHSGGAGEYDGLAGADVAVTVTDDDTPALVVTAPSDPLGVDEGAAATYTVRLGTEPSGPVTVAVASDDPGAATVDPTSLSFTAGNWDTPVTVTVAGAGDDDAGDESATLTHTASGADYEGETATLIVAVTDDDEPGVTVAGGPFTLTENGAAGTYTVVLATLPSAGTVTVTVASDDAAVTVDPTSLAFTASDWNVAQALTVTAVDDANATGETATLTHTAAHTGGAAEYAGLAGRTVRITVDDDDAPGLALVWTGDPDPLAVTEGGATATYTVALHTQPSGPVTVALASSDTGAATVDPTSLSFTTGNWSTAQTVTVTGAGDDDAGDETVTLTHTASGADYGAVSKTLAVAVADDDTAAVTVSPESLALKEDRAGTWRATYTVVLATEPSAGTVRVAVASDDTGAVTVAPAALTFTASNWDTAKTVTVTARRGRGRDRRDRDGVAHGGRTPAARSTPGSTWPTSRSPSTTPRARGWW